MRTGLAIAALAVTSLVLSPATGAQEGGALQARGGPPFEVRSFAPHSGPPGTRIEITGSGFRPDDQVELGDAQLPVVDISSRRIVVQVPWRSRSALLTVIRPAAGIGARSPTRFVVTAPAVVAPGGRPFIAGFSPAGGPPTTVVTLRGTGFTSDLRVTYGDQALPVFPPRGEGILTVVVPRSARRNARFVISNHHGESRSARAFELQLDDDSLSVGR